MRTNLRIRIFLALALLAPTVVLAQIPASSRTMIEAYRTAIRSLQSRRDARGLEAAFSRFVSVREALLPILESLSDADFQRLKGEIPGAIVNREEVILLEPDSDFFAKLAATNGDPADRGFFTALKATYPDSVWPVYIEQQTDYSGCTAFGTGKLVEIYRAWTEFQKLFPQRYAVPARKEAERVEQELAQSTCACGDTQSAEREMQQFLRELPNAPIQAKIAERLRAVQAGRADIRAQCIAR